MLLATVTWSVRFGTQDGVLQKAISDFLNRMVFGVSELTSIDKH